MELEKTKLDISGRLDIVETPHEIKVMTESALIRFDKVYGKLSGYEVFGEEILVEGLEENFFRAPTDNDERGWEMRTDCSAGEWRKEGLDQLKRNVKSVNIEFLDKKVTITVEANFARTSQYLAFETKVLYMITADGQIEVTVDFKPMKKLDELPRLGMKMTLKKEYDQFSWFGRGPHESYRDKKESALVGLYSGSVKDQYEPYIIPQENGNKTDTRWCALTNKNGNGLMVKAENTMDTSVMHYTQEKMSAAKQTYDLVEIDGTVINIDYGQTGIGNGSCGPGNLDQYKLKAEPVQFSYKLVPHTLI